MSKPVAFCVVVGALLACKSADKSSGPSPAAAASSSATPAAAAAHDEPQTTKRVGDLDVTYVNGSAVKTHAMAAFRIVNKSDEEKVISSVVSFQMSSVSGQTGELDIMMAKCDGHVAPGATFVCALAYKFSGTTPTDVRIRVADGLLEGVWFRVKLQQK